MSGHRVSTANIAFRWFRSGINLGRKPPLRWCCWETLKKVLTEGSKTLQPPYPTNIIRAIKVLALQEAGVPHAVASRISTSCHLRCKPVGPETSLSPHFTHTLHHVNHTTPSSKDFLLSTYTLTKTAQVMYIYIYTYVSLTVRTVCWRQDSLGSASICERPYSLKAFKNNAFFGTSSCPKTFVGIFRKLARAPHEDFYPTHNLLELAVGEKTDRQGTKVCDRVATREQRCWAEVCNSCSWCEAYSSKTNRSPNLSFSWCLESPRLQG